LSSALVYFDTNPCSTAIKNDDQKFFLAQENIILLKRKLGNTPLTGNLYFCIDSLPNPAYTQSIEASFTL
jgi:hypothetical protein